MLQQTVIQRKKKKWKATKNKLQVGLVNLPALNLSKYTVLNQLIVGNNH